MAEKPYNEKLNDSKNMPEAVEITDSKAAFMKEVTAAIIRDGDKILICQRAADDECAMLWEFPGGKRENGETLEECIIREIREELELDIRVLGIFTKSIYHFNNNEIYFTLYNAEIIGGELQRNVHNAVEWVTVEEIGEYDFMPADIGFVEKILKERN